MDHPTPLRLRVVASVSGLMKSKGETELGLSIGSSIPRTTLRRSLEGQRPLDLDEVERIAQHFGVSPISILQGRHAEKAAA